MNVLFGLFLLNYSRCHNDHYVSVTREKVRIVGNGNA